VGDAALHVTNGDATVPELLATGLMETVLPWRDVLHEGPVPDVPDAELRAIRARFLNGENAADVGTEAELERRDRTLAAGRGGAYMLWFEADLYDQLQLVQILARLQELGVSAERVTLICIGEHLGSAHFGGLGELDAGQLARLPDTAAAVLTPAALELAASAWAALRAPEPAGLRAIAATPSAELRFLAAAFDRLGREYPSTRDGLSLTERRLLAAVAAGAPDAGAAFVRAAAKEARPFLGDTWAFDRMTRLATCQEPLLEAGAPVARGTRLALTATGRRVLEGEADHVALNGVDRWIGGVHLQGRAVPWRWDEGTESVAAASPARAGPW
jgi:hypothetical protein